MTAIEKRPDDDLGALGALGRIVSLVHSTQMVSEQLRGKEAECLAVALRAHELGVPVMQALGGDLFVVHGRVGMSAELMRSLVLRHGHSIELRSTLDPDDGLTVTAIGRRSTGESDEVSWSLTQARQAKLGGVSWDRYPSAMLAARASSELCRRLFPDVLRGVSYTAEELRSIEVEAVELPPEAPYWWGAWWAQVRETTAAAVAADDEGVLGVALTDAWQERGYSVPLTLDQAQEWLQALAQHGVEVEAPPVEVEP